jgi:acetyl esterase/lipase
MSKKLSLRGKVVTFVLRKFLNFNPGKNKNVIKATKRLEKLGFFCKPCGFELEKFSVEGIPMEIFKKKGTEPKNLIFIIHGGAFIAGLGNLYRAPYKLYHKAGHGAAVANIDYRTAPEHTYPAAHDDVMRGWEALLEKGYLPENITVVGDSAGGNLTLSLLLKLRDAGKAMPRAAVLMSPWADLNATGQSYRTNYKVDPMFGDKKGEVLEENVEIFLKSDLFSYAGNADRNDPYLSPILGEYHGMPPAFFSVGAVELLRDEGLAVANKMKDAGSHVEVDIADHMFHVFPVMYQFMPEGRRGFNKILDFIDRQFK